MEGGNSCPSHAIAGGGVLRSSISTIGTTTVLLLTVLGTAQGQSSMRVISQIGGTTYDVAVQDNVLYMGKGMQLSIVDVSDPSEPVILGHSDLLPEQVRRVAVADNLAFVGTQGSIHILDVSDPSQLVNVGIFDEVVDPSDITVSGNRMYVVETSGSFSCVDISSPESPQTIYHSWGSGIAVRNDLTYTVGGSPMLEIWDFSGSYPTVVGSLMMEENGTHIYADDQFLYVTSNYVMQILDISDPTHPVYVGQWNNSHWQDNGPSIYVSNGYAYIPQLCSYTINIVNILDPTTPEWVASFEVPDFLPDRFRITGDSDRLFLPVGGLGCRILDIGNPTQPTQIGHAFEMGYANQVTTSGHHAYIASSANSVVAVDLTTPTSPQITVIVETSAPVTDLAPADSTLYAATLDGMDIMSLAEPDSPIIVGTFQLAAPTDYRLVAVDDDLAFLADDSSVLTVIDVSTPTNPVQLGQWAGPNTLPDYPLRPRGLVVKDNVVFFSNSFMQIAAIDVSDPINPNCLTMYFGTYGCAESLRGNYLYGFTLVHRLSTYDVTSPSSPQRVGDPLSFDFWPTGQWGSPRIASSEDRVYIGSPEYTHLVEVDVSEPASPRSIAHLSARPSDIAAFERTVLVAGGNDGLLVIQAGDPDEDWIDDRTDNCLEVYNPDQTDSDNDSVGDACDACSQTPFGLPVDESGCPLPLPGDADSDLDVDQEDFGLFQACFSGAGVTQDDPNCASALLDGDDDVDLDDFGLLQACMSGPGVVADPDCIE